MKPLPLLFAALTVGASGFAQIANAPCWESNYGTNLWLYNYMNSPNLPLGFTFTFAGTNYTEVSVGLSGIIWLGGNFLRDGYFYDYLPYYENNYLQQYPPNIAAFLSSQYFYQTPPVGNNVYYNTFAATATAPARAVITWINIPCYYQGPEMSAQVQILSSGEFTISQGANTLTGQYSPNSGYGALVGCSEGTGNPAGSATSNQIDYQSIVTTPVDTGTGTTAYELFNDTNYDITGMSFEFIPNGQGGYGIYHRPGCQFAYYRPEGRGCPLPPIVYELFSSSSVDLSNTSIHFLPNGVGGWTVVPGYSSFYTNYSNTVSLSDDSVNQNHSLGFNFTTPAGTVSSVDVSSNGFVWLASSQTNSRCCSGNVNSFLRDAPSVAALWQDMYPPGAAAQGGGVYSDQDPSGSAWYYTFYNVPEYYTNPNCTFQTQLFSTGDFELIYETVVNVSHTCLVGYSTGNGAEDPGGIDYTASVPFDTGVGGLPLTLNASPSPTGGFSRPVLGATFSMDLTNIPSNTTAGFMILGLTSYHSIGGISLQPVGMDACFQWASLDTILPFAPTIPTSTYSLNVPNTGSLVGFVVYTQAATLSPGYTALGAISSNGGAMILGQ